MKIKAVVMPDKNQPLSLQDFDFPNMEEGAILLETIYSEVCGTDCHLHKGRLAGVPYPIIPGHVSVGKISKINGEKCDVDGEPFKVGDIVTFWDVICTCGKCWFCLVAKAHTKCPSRKVYGVTTSCKDGLLGGWSEFIYLTPNTQLLRLPPNVTPEMFISGGCGMPTAFHAVERARIKMNDTVVIQGCGPVGLCSSIFAQLSGASKIIVVGAPKLRLNFAKELGADEVIDIFEENPQKRLEHIKDLTRGRGADVVIEASGNPRAVKEGLEYVRDYGTYVIVGQYTDCGSVEINPHVDINKKHLDIRGCWGVDFHHLYRSLSLMNKHAKSFPWEKMISKQYGLHEANDALSDVSAHRVIKAIINPGKKKGPNNEDL